MGARPHVSWLKERNVQQARRWLRPCVIKSCQQCDDVLFDNQMMG